MVLCQWNSQNTECCQRVDLGFLKRMYMCTATTSECRKKVDFSLLMANWKEVLPSPHFNLSPPLQYIKNILHFKSSLDIQHSCRQFPWDERLMSSVHIPDGNSTLLSSAKVLWWTRRISVSLLLEHIFSLTETVHGKFKTDVGLGEVWREPIDCKLSLNLPLKLMPGIHSI